VNIAHFVMINSFLDIRLFINETKKEFSKYYIFSYILQVGSINYKCCFNETYFYL